MKALLDKYNVFYNS
ncbi:6109e9cc-b868-46d1-b915-06f4f787a115 [Thermothielavioides terrestris]|uniref:6109e9cc-b868-46d1-b915-06f4f787a115 n=1 Tax=Thermothielavioides terrestris TaxID=2587410 RepID=A0A3S4ASS9_9PEZI|nr:6109e9cc-b868-46d1-b915-06f4f787a115 [Thermothielavioides terrestris]